MDGVSRGLVVLLSPSRELGSLGLCGDRSGAIAATGTLSNGSCSMTSARSKEIGVDRSLSFVEAEILSHSLGQRSQLNLGVR